MHKLKKWIIACFMLGATILISSISRDQFTPLFILYTSFFALYLTVLNDHLKRNEVIFWIIIGLLLRASTIVFFPNLSDDIYRFIWDGELLRQGINPFNATPSALIEQSNLAFSVDPQLYDKLNSPEYFTVYPPIAQLLFFIGSYLFEGNWWLQSSFLKLIILLAEIGSIFFIRRILLHFGMPEKRVLWYALNPLVIIELCGNIHFEGLMIFFFLLSFWYLTQKKYFLAGVAFGFSFLAKLITAISAPFLLKRIPIKNLILLILGGVLITVLGFLPLLNGQFGENFGDSLNLYFQKFEFNGSFYYLVRWFGYQWKGFNMIAEIGPFLALLGVVGIILTMLTEKKRNLDTFPLMALFALSIYFLFGTTVHPWYTATLVALCCFTNLKYPVLWSYLIFLTYINYSYDPYKENLWVVGFEYFVLFGFIAWELIQKRHKKSALTSDAKALYIS